MAVNPQSAKAQETIAGLRQALEKAIDTAAGLLVEGGASEANATAQISAQLVSLLSQIMAQSADQGRAADSRTFEAMFDVNAATSHFQDSLVQGLRHAADAITKDGYDPAIALTLASSRALDSVSDVLKSR